MFNSTQNVIYFPFASRYKLVTYSLNLLHFGVLVFYGKISLKTREKIREISCHNLIDRMILSIIVLSNEL